MDVENISARYIKGVGPDRLKLLKRLSINTVRDALLYFPRRYEDRSNIKPVSELTPDVFQTVKARVVSSSVFRSKNNKVIFQLIVSDGTANLYCLWFRQPYMKRYFQPEDTVILYGRVQKTTRLQIIHPEYEIIRDARGKEESPIHTGRIVPIYPLASGVNQRALRRIIKNSIDQYALQLEDMLPAHIRQRHKLLDTKSAVNNIHFPEDDGLKQAARRRLVFDEFFILQAALAIKRQNITQQHSAVTHEICFSREKEFFNILGFEPTRAQKRVMEDIKKDMQGSRPMHRLVQGEVGSGKTIVSAYALFLTCINGHQGCVMVPTEILAGQHYITLSKIFAQLGVDVVMLTNGMKKTEKTDALERIHKGIAQVIVGTHTLIQKGIGFKDLGLVIVDEQHKFGVEQRAALKMKNKNPDMLVMTATPIPRTMAMTLYGDMDISVIDELPQGKRDVKTMWQDSRGIDEIYDFIKEQLALGRQAYIICPVIEESKTLKSQGAAFLYDELRSVKFKDFNLGLLHGRLDDVQKKEVMSDFKKKKIDLLIATTIVEVGIDVPNASIMVIMNAERFGLSQLHQLRGRIGRGSEASFCILVSDADSEYARQRLEAVSKIENGFDIAQEDLNRRGPGELFGVKQHGEPLLALGNIISDVDILEQARREAFSLIASDPRLEDKSHEKLKTRIQEKFKDSFCFGFVG